MELHHLALVVADLRRAEDFYVGVLGMTVMRRGDDDRGVPRSIWLSLGGATFLALERAEKTEPVRDDGAPGLHCLALATSVSARAALQSKLHSAGFSTIRETAYTFYVRDPDGTLVGFSHYPES